MKMLVVAMLAVLLFAPIASAGAISIENWRGRQVLKLSGTIEDGLAEQFLSIADQVEPFPHGARVLLLDSPGGSVVEALKISKILDEMDFHTIVPNGSKCASACASIVFIAGTYRTVEAFGSFGQHSCAVNGVPNVLCNEVLATHAVEHGVSHGAVAAFVTYTPPEEMLWFSREEVDGWGLSKYPGSAQSGFERSEDLVIKLLRGRVPDAQAAWRLDFYRDGYRAFLRPAADSMREMQLSVFCTESEPGRLMLSMEVPETAQDMIRMIGKAVVKIDDVEWEDADPAIRTVDKDWLAVVVLVPTMLIKRFLTETDALEFAIEFDSKYDPLIAQTSLSTSRDVLLFAANNCATN